MAAPIPTAVALPAAVPFPAAAVHTAADLANVEPCHTAPNARRSCTRTWQLIYDPCRSVSVMRLGVTLVPLNLYLDTRPATCVGQFFCEAALNAIKHGFPDGSSGHVMTKPSERS